MLKRLAAIFNDYRQSSLKSRRSYLCSPLITHSHTTSKINFNWAGKVMLSSKKKKLLTSSKKIILFCSYARQTSKKSIWELFMLDLMKPFVFIIFHLFSLCSTIYRTSEFVSRVIHHQYSLEMLFDLEVFFFGQISRWIYLMSILCYYNPKIFIFSILNQYCFTCLWLMTSSGVDFWLEIYFALSYQISPKVNRNTRKVWRKTIKYSILNESRSLEEIWTHNNFRRMCLIIQIPGIITCKASKRVSELVNEEIQYEKNDLMMTRPSLERYKNTKWATIFCVFSYDLICIFL